MKRVCGRNAFSPPVSLDGVEDGLKSAHAAASEALQKVNYVQMQADQDREFVKWDQERQDHQILELEEEIEALAPTFDRGEWAFD